MKNKYLADTMAIVLFLEKRKLPSNVKDLFQKAEIEKIEISISAITLAEIAYLSEKNRIDIDLASTINFFNSNPSFDIIDLCLKDIQVSFLIDNIPELHDRLIAGSALARQIPIITNDPKIIASRFVETIWE